jgi:xanthine phosphoribosyltransferase
MNRAGKEFAKHFREYAPTKILTAEISGIAPALLTGFHMDLPVVFARKHKPITMPDQVLLTLTPSHTKGRTVELIISPEYLGKKERVLIIDDFLATGMTILGLIRLAEAAGSTVIGVGTLIEKTFEDGRSLLENMNLPVHSLARIKAMEDDQIIFQS